CIFITLYTFTSFVCCLQNADLSSIPDNVTFLKFNFDVNLFDYDFPNRGVIVGGKDVLYALTVDNLGHRIHLHWISNKIDKVSCELRGKPTSLCNNYLRVYQPLKHSNYKQIFICGTNSFKPICRSYKYPDLKMLKEYHEFGLSPNDPRVSVVYNYGNNNNDLYVATIAGSSASDALIIRPFSKVRTQRFNDRIFNSPQFIKAVSVENRMLFFFRELAFERNFAPVSRIARICENDNGGNASFKSIFTTFRKTTIHCSVKRKNARPIVLHNLTSVSEITVKLISGNKYSSFYASFTGKELSESRKIFFVSAVCHFSLNDIIDNFDKAVIGYRRPGSPLEAITFEQKINDYVDVDRSNRNRKAAIRNLDPCEFKLSEAAQRFNMDHTLTSYIAEDMNALKGSSPFFVYFHESVSLTFIYDHEIKLNFGNVTLAYIGTSDGRVMKVFETASKQHNFQSELQVFPSDTAVKHIFLTSKDWCNMSAKVVVFSNNSMRVFNVTNCELVKTCKECVGSKDPYCFWNISGNQCMRSCNPEQNNDIIQNLLTGDDRRCEEIDKKGS
ncbi:semaphorin-1A-like protein, partial [Leptotrombidium deliense]